MYKQTLLEIFKNIDKKEINYFLNTITKIKNNFLDFIVSKPIKIKLNFEFLNILTFIYTNTFNKKLKKEIETEIKKLNKTKEIENFYSFKTKENFIHLYLINPKKYIKNFEEFKLQNYDPLYYSVLALMYASQKDFKKAKKAKQILFNKLPKERIYFVETNIALLDFTINAHNYLLKKDKKNLNKEIEKLVKKTNKSKFFKNFFKERLFVKYFVVNYIFNLLDSIKKNKKLKNFIFRKIEKKLINKILEEEKRYKFNIPSEINKLFKDSSVKDAFFKYLKTLEDFKIVKFKNKKEKEKFMKILRLFSLS